jgi:hypothetical protein
VQGATGAQGMQGVQGVQGATGQLPSDLTALTNLLKTYSGWSESGTIYLKAVDGDIQWGG